MAATTKAVRKAIYTKLTGSSSVTNLLYSATSIYHGVAPDTADFPFIIIQKQAGTPTYTFGDKAWDHQVWLIKAVARSDTSDAAEDIAAAVEALLVPSGIAGTLSISGGTLKDMRRESDVDYLETDGDQTYRHHGSLYRLAVT